MNSCIEQSNPSYITAIKHFNSLIFPIVCV
nr:MAG TPA: hypothetical protein [Bacteriophage sp.]